jgi:cysteine desulfurase
MKRIFLDYASTTPLDKKVEKAMQQFVAKNFGNPSALYKEGVEAKLAVKESREKISKLLNVRTEEIIFTASGTEADNLALIGLFNYYKKDFISKGCVPHIVTSVIEHSGILETCKYIEREGGEVSYVEVEENGIVDPNKIKALLKPNTILVSVMLANNEIGTIQPIRDISRIIKEYREKNNTEFPFLHTDASQAANYLDLSFQKLGVDLMTLDGSKIYGPKGIGLLAARRLVPLTPIVFGGGQEKNLRAGTENVPAIVGIAEAITLVQNIKNSETERLLELQTYFFEQVIKRNSNVCINGDRNKRLPNNVNICIDGLDAEFAVIKLDHLGVSCSAASSCLNLSENSYSYVLNALGKRGKACRESSLRFSFGRATTKAEIILTLKKIQSIMST